MSVSRPFILRPVATSLLMLALLMSGILAWRLLPVAALPQVDYPIIQVFTFNPGASPEVMARTITAPLERRLGQIPGLKQMSSTSSTGASIITLQFSLEVDLGVAEQEVQRPDDGRGDDPPQVGARAGLAHHFSGYLAGHVSSGKPPITSAVSNAEKPAKCQ